MPAIDTETSIPQSIAEVSPEFLTAVFRHAGMLRQGDVVGFRSRVVGEGAGFMSQVVDICATFSADSGQPPHSVVVKFPTASLNRQVGQTLGVYEREIRFYRELQPILNIRTPRHYFSAMSTTADPEAARKVLALLDRMPLWLIRRLLQLANWMNARTALRYVLVIEQLGGLRAGDQVSGCSAADAKRALETMARMHGQFWESSALAAWSWLVPMRYAARPGQMLFLQTVDRFTAHHARTLSPHTVHLLEWLKTGYFELMDRLAERPATLVHGDFRLDNLCFDDGSGEVVLFDWQTPSVGSGGIDLAYFLSAAVTADAPDDMVDELVTFYQAELASHGVTVSSADLRWDYDAGLLLMLHRLVPSQFQDMLVLGEGRGTDLLDTWLQRITHHLTHVDPAKLMSHVPGLEGPAVTGGRER